VRQLYAVTRTQGPGFDDGRALEAQDGWKEHEAFMNALVDAGFLVAAGLLKGTREALLVFWARDEDEIRERLEADPWTTSRTLLLTRACPWEVRLGSLE
jgi:hypothetical protein